MLKWPKTIETKTPYETALNVRWYLIILELPGIYTNKHEFCRFLEKIVGIKKETRNIFVKWINEYSKERFQKLVLNVRKILADLVGLFIHHSCLQIKMTNGQLCVFVHY